MEDLAPDIVRQRLLIEGFYELDIDAAVIESYFGRLCDGLGLQAYGNPTLFSPAGKGQEINQEITRATMPSFHWSTPACPCTRGLPGASSPSSFSPANASTRLEPWS
jgi:hypothetical protein